MRRRFDATAHKITAGLSEKSPAEPGDIAQIFMKQMEPPRGRVTSPWLEQGRLRRVSEAVLAARRRWKPASGSRDEEYPRRLAVIREMRDLIERQLAERERWIERMHNGLPGSPPREVILRAMPDDANAITALRELGAALDKAEAALEWPRDPRAGMRSNGAWREPARIIGGVVKETMLTAGYGPVTASCTKENPGPFVRVMVALTALAGLGTHEPPAVAKALSDL